MTGHPCWTSHLRNVREWHLELSFRPVGKWIKFLASKRSARSGTADRRSPPVECTFLKPACKYWDFNYQTQLFFSRRISEPSTEGVYLTQFLLQIQDGTMTFLCWKVLGPFQNIVYSMVNKVWVIKLWLFNRNIHSPSLTWNLKLMVSNRNLLFGRLSGSLNFRGVHVFEIFGALSLQNNSWIWSRWYCTRAFSAFVRWDFSGVTSNKYELLRSKPAQILMWWDRDLFFSELKA